MDFEKYIIESSLGRIYQHIKKKNVDSWAILTSYRDENSPSENKKNFKELKNKIRSMNLGFIELEGIGQEEDGENNIIQVKEPSLFIPNINKKQAQSLSGMYNQWGYIYSGKEVDNKIALISIEGIEYIGDFRPNKIAQFFSKIKGKPFTFEGTKPTSNMERYWKYLKNKQ